MSNFTPYAAAKLVNAQLKDMGIDKKLPAQMFYTYTAKGYITSTLGPDGKRTITQEALTDWFIKYCTKNKLTPTTTTEDEFTIDPNQYTLDLDGVPLIIK